TSAAASRGTERKTDPESAARSLQGVHAALAGADPHHLFHRHDEDFAVADSAGARRALDRLDDLRRQLVRNDYLELDLGQKVHDVLGAAVQLGMPLLTAESLDLADRETLHTDTRQGLFDLVELERLDDRLNLLHKSPLGPCSDWPRVTHAGPRLIPHNHSPKMEMVQAPCFARAPRRFRW